MASLLILVPISLILFGAAIWAFIWAVRGGQFDDLDTPSIDILRNDPADVKAAPASDPTGQGDDAD
jgi:cbb3-type cytochrome oxidase maturation protein